MSNHSHSNASSERGSRDDDALARKALALLSSERADDRKSWLEVGMALHSVSLDLLDDWDRWSQQSDKYTPGECARQWRSFEAKPGGVTIASLIQWARDDSGDQGFGKSRVSQKRGETFATLEDAAKSAAAKVRGAPTQTWQYERAEGTPVLWVLRLDLGRAQDGKASKTFRPIHRDADGFHLGDPPGQLPLYRLSKLATAGTIYVTEGEKAADAAASIGLNATTSAHGALSPHRTDWTPIVGRSVVILIDNDDAGRGYGERVAQLILAKSPNADIRIVLLPGLPPSGDIVEYLASERATGRADAEIKQAIEALAASTQPGVSDVSGGKGAASSSWPEPQPLVDELPPVERFDACLLPEKLRTWILDIAERMQCPIDFLGATLLVALATIVGRSIGIRPKRLDAWSVVANLWGAVIGRPGILKTPAIQEVLRPIKWLETEAKKVFDEARAEFNAKAFVADERKKNQSRKIGKCDDQDEALRMSREILKQVPDAPTRRRFIVNDSTVEKLGVLLNENPNGLLVYRDELIGFLRSLDKEGNEGARAFYLEAWNGTGRFTYDRITRGTIDIDAATVSIIGSIQPGPLASYLRTAIDSGAGDDGLVQRFQLSVWPDVSPDWKNVDRLPDTAASKTAFETFARLHATDPLLAGAEFPEEGSGEVPFLRFNAAAQQRFDEWRTELELRVRSRTEHVAVESHLAKYRSLVPSIALLLHLADDLNGPVGLGQLEKAIGWARYLESHAKRIYSIATNPDVACGRVLARKVLAGAVKDRFSLRDVYRPNWTGLGTREDALRAVSHLLDLDWLREVKEPSGTGYKTVYAINPKVRGMEAPFGATDNTASPPGGADPHGADREADEPAEDDGDWGTV